MKFFIGLKYWSKRTLNSELDKTLFDSSSIIKMCRKYVQMLFQSNHFELNIRCLNYSHLFKLKTTAGLF